MVMNAILVSPQFAAIIDEVLTDAVQREAEDREAHKAWLLRHPWPQTDPYFSYEKDQWYNGYMPEKNMLNEFNPHDFGMRGKSTSASILKNRHGPLVQHYKKYPTYLPP